MNDATKCLDKSLKNSPDCKSWRGNSDYAVENEGDQFVSGSVSLAGGGWFPQGHEVRLPWFSPYLDKLIVLLEEGD